MILVVCVISFSSSSFWEGASERRVALMAMAVTVGYGFLVGNLIEIGENERFRFETQALVFLVATVFIHQLWERLRSFPRAEGIKSDA